MKPAVVSALLGAILLVGCGGDAKDAKAPAKASDAKAPPGATKPPARKVPVTVTTLVPRPLIYAIHATGQLSAREVVRIPARVPGIVEDVAFDAGTIVRKGTLLARIDSERYRLEAAREEARVAEAGSQLALAQAQLDRRRALAGKNPEWVSADEMAGFSARVDQERAAVAAAEAALDLAKKELRDSEVRAESSGVIEEKLVETGEHVEEGRALATIVDVSRLRLTMKVSETEAARLDASPKITFRVKSVPEKAFEATLAHVSAAADATTRQVELLAWIDAPPPELKPGYFAEAVIEVGGSPAAIVVPPTSVLATERGIVAFVVEGGVAHERRVSPGLHGVDGDVEILDGLKAGEVVVVRGAAALRDGAEVQVEEPS